jgi:hypothetical protein
MEVLLGNILREVIKWISPAFLGNTTYFET